MQSQNTIKQTFQISPQIRVLIVQGDIAAEFGVDAITNAANGDLWFGSGVAGKIREKAGYQIENECNALRSRIGQVSEGQVVHTGSGNLQNIGIKYVIHAVGPQ